MNELFEFLGTVRVVAWVYLGAVFALATGLILFDRRKAAPSERAGEVTPERKAA
jgi:hypothetical protein